MESRPHGTHVAFETVGMEQDWTKLCVEELAQFARDYVPSDISAQQLVVHGKAFQEVIRIAEAEQCDLVVVATHGHGGLAHVFLGSVAERIVNHAPCPLLVVRGSQHVLPAFPEVPPKWIMLTTDFSENSLKAFPLAEALAREYKARLTLTYVIPSPHLLSELSLTYLKEDLARHRKDTEIRLCEFRARHLATDLAVDVVVHEGIVHQLLAEIAPLDPPGLIVMATQGTTGWKHALLGSTAEKVLRHAPCPVLVIR